MAWRALTDAQWERIRPHLPREKRQPHGGRPRADPRRCFEGILWVLRTGAPWSELPPRYGSPATCWRRLRNPPVGPESIEGFYDDALAVPGLLAEIAKGEAQGVSAHVIACFDDTGLDAARALAGAPAPRPGRPVIGGVAGGVALAETLVRLGLRPSKRGGYAPPLPKRR